ncbi:MAG: membrane protein insertase YidC [Corallococcus sp.]|nr:membrane protein insertase YidC [Corallococcus sp.]
MKRKANLIILTVMLALLCLGIFAACSPTAVDYFKYSENDLGVVGKLVRWMHGWMGEGNYGWTVVVFTVFLKLITLPLDMWQRISTRKSTLKMQKIQPLMEEIDKRYGANTQRANAEKQKLYKKQGYSMFSTCLPMIVTMVIFFVMFGGLRDYSTYSSVMNFRGLSDTYMESYVEQVEKDTDNAKWDAYWNGETIVTESGSKEWKGLSYYKTNAGEKSKDYEKWGTVLLDGIGEFRTIYGDEADAVYREKALDAVSEYYKGHHESWLWIENVWQPDTWASIMPGYNDSSNGFSSSVDMKAFGTDGGVGHYDMIRNAVLKTGGHGGNGSWNGLMLLPILSIGLSFLSIFISQLMDKKNKKSKNGEPEVKPNAQQAATNKTMMIIMPLMMAFFGFMYTGAFAIYMVCNYTLSILATVALRWPVEKIVEKSLAKSDKKEKKPSKADYMR